MPDPAGVFARLAVRAGIGAENYTAREIWSKDEPGRAHVVYRFDGPDRSLVLKSSSLAGDATGFRAAAAAQARACAALGDGHDTVPVIYAISDDPPAILSAAFDGETADAILAGAKPAAQSAVLRRAGAWLRAYHAAFPGGQRPYRTKFMLGHLSRLSAEIAAGTRRVPRRDLFLAAARRVAEGAGRFDGRMARAAAAHGDFNLRNLLIAGNKAAAIDFKPEASAPVGHDVSRFVTDAAALYGPGQAVEFLAAFLEGYAPDPADDASIRFLAGLRPLLDWATIPQRTTDRSLRQHIRFRGLLKMVRVYE